MKKGTIALLCAALTTLIGASIWEGSAVVAATGELPESGYYIATNSFPRNTVVDVKNLETEKTVRAIVAGPLDSPGLLAALSAEAADAVGLGKRTVGRVRVTMPADPIAFSRFTDGLAESSDPDRNPKAALTDESAAEKKPAETASPAEVPVPAVAEAPAQAVLPSEPAVPAEPAQAAATAVVESAPTETAAETTPPAETAESIIDVPENYVPPAPIAEQDEAKAESTVLSALPESGNADVALEEPAPPASPEASEEPAPTETPMPETVAPSSAETDKVPEITAEPEVATEPEVAAEPEVEPKPEVAAEPEVEPKPEVAAEPMPAEPGEVVLQLEPAEERPPIAAEPDISIEPTVEPIAAPTEVADATAAPAESEKQLDPALFLEPLPSPARTAETTRPPAAEVAPIATPIVEAPVQAPAPTAKSTTPESAIRVEAKLIASLEKGKYYVQLGAFADAATVNQAVAELGKVFPTAVQEGRNGERPFYRIFVGPVNQGESGALLLRFKNRGYPDAFIRKGI